MVDSLVNEYETWRCGDQEVILGIRAGMVLFARCTCPRANRQAEIELIRDRTWSWESSYCVHTYTVLAHYYAEYASGDLVTERLVEGVEEIDVEVVESPSEGSENPAKEERQEAILDYIDGAEEAVSVADIEQDLGVNSHDVVYDLFELMQFGKVYAPRQNELRTTRDID